MKLRTLLVSGMLAASASLITVGALAGQNCNYEAKASAANIIQVSTDAQSSFDPSDYVDAPLRITVTREFDASPDVVFAALIDHEGMVEWMPTLDKVTVDYTNSDNPGGNGAGTTRECVAGKDVFVEDIRYLSASERILAYSVDMERSTTSLPFITHLGVLRVESRQEGGSLVTWNQYLEVKKGLKGKLVIPMLKYRLMKKGLKNLDKRLDKQTAGAMVSL